MTNERNAWIEQRVDDCVGPDATGAVISISYARKLCTIIAHNAMAFADAHPPYIDDSCELTKEQWECLLKRAPKAHTPPPAQGREKVDE